ncbi:head-tail connector protein [Mycobacterium phage MyraDee]|uniref:Head-to-tail connector protein n=1 Tax=Mycobacterium phage MyraDee TaxID=2024303 RepID=A0A222YZ76_9CAUD|nr:head-tail connector protein [Mycobacterium phage MyraDee]ASR77124.1 head-to-tail connector protein [Mycobacterium phage MyraDee]
MSYGEPELVPQTPVLINGRLFNPARCVHDVDPDAPHVCVHDWRVYWGQQTRTEQ